MDQNNENKDKKPSLAKMKLWAVTGAAQKVMEDRLAEADNQEKAQGEEKAQ